MDFVFDSISVNAYWNNLAGYPRTAGGGFVTRFCAVPGIKYNDNGEKMLQDVRRIQD